MEINEKQFITGFNAGYLLAEYEPQILTALLNNMQPVNSYISGLSFGQKEYELDQTRDDLSELNMLRQKSRKEQDRNIN